MLRKTGGGAEREMGDGARDRKETETVCVCVSWEGGGADRCFD